MAKTEKTIMVIMMVVIMAAVLTQVVQAMTPQKTYCCPLCTDVCFYTYDELYSHFVTAHPAIDIEIIWD